MHMNKHATLAHTHKYMLAHTSGVSICPHNSQSWTTTKGHIPLWPQDRDKILLHLQSRHLYVAGAIKSKTIFTNLKTTSSVCVCVGVCVFVCVWVCACVCVNMCLCVECLPTHHSKYVIDSYSNICKPFNFGPPEGNSRNHGFHEKSGPVTVRHLSLSNFVPNI